MIKAIPMGNSIKIPYNENMHFEHQNWKSELAFWKDEIKIFNNRLSTLVTRWTQQEVLEELEHFQSEFVVYGAMIEEFEEAIKEHEANMANRFHNGNRSLRITLTKKHAAHRMKMEKQRQRYTDLKNDFFRFLSKNA